MKNSQPLPSVKTRLSELTENLQISLAHKRYFSLCKDPVWFGRAVEDIHKQIDMLFRQKEHLHHSRQTADNHIRICDAEICSLQEQIVEEHSRLIKEGIAKEAARSRKPKASFSTSSKQPVRTKALPEGAIRVMMERAGMSRAEAIEMLTR